MDVGTASALSLYNYQTTLNGNSQGAGSSSASTGSTAPTSGSAQDAAVLQALTSTYASLTTSSNSLLTTPDALSALAGSSALIPLVSGIYSASVANGNASSAFSGLSTSMVTEGGLSATSASILFSSNNASNNASGMDGFSSTAINMNASLALAAYSNYQNGIPSGTLGAAASAAAAKIDTTQTSTVQTAIQAAQSASLTSSLNLFG